MSPEEQLRQWFIQLSTLIGGDLPEDNTLDTCLEWFGSLGDDTLTQVNNLGRDNPAIQEFLDLGRTLMDTVAN